MLGGEAAIIEIVLRGQGGARGELIRLSGHPNIGWRRTETRRFSLSVSEYRGLAGGIDAALADYRPLPTALADQGNEVMIVCTDGPGYTTERVRGGEVISLTGFCPDQVDAIHANRRIARLFDELLRRKFGRAFRVDLRVGQDD